MECLDGKAVSLQIREGIARRIEAFTQKGGRKPHLVMVLVGEQAASLAYIKAKMRACEEVGFDSTVIRKPAATSEAELLALVAELNRDAAIDGFIVQLPLPEHLDPVKVIQAIDPRKDVDGFHPTNLGKLALEMDTFIPATPYGILELIKHYAIPTVGKRVVVLGRSPIVGKPISILMSRKAYPGNATVTLCHSQTRDTAALTRQADLIITALGVPGFLTVDHVKAGCAVIDVGINRVADPSVKQGYRLVGDVDFESVRQKAAYLTPVPGGVGPMTVSMLLKNTLQAYEWNGAQTGDSSLR